MGQEQRPQSSSISPLMRYKIAGRIVCMFVNPGLKSVVVEQTTQLHVINCGHNKSSKWLIPQHPACRRSVIAGPLPTMHTGCIVQYLTWLPAHPQQPGSGVADLHLCDWTVTLLPEALIGHLGFWGKLEEVSLI